MKQRLFTLMLMASFSIAMMAIEVDGIYYNVSSSTASVTYKDTNYNSYSGNVVIPETITYNGKIYPVTSIGSKAFYNCSGLTSVTIPDGVTSIGQSAFDYCTKLPSVTIPSSVEVIGIDAFNYCISLTSVTIPEGVKNISQWAFYSCTSLSDITIPSSVTSIGKQAFYDTPYYNNQPDGVVYIGNFALAYKGTMPSNTEIVLRDGTTGIADGAFRDQHNLTSVTIPSNVTSIGNSAFEDCTGLTSVTIPEGVTSIGEWAFANCSGLTSVTIPSSVTSIGHNAFYNTPYYNNQPDGVVYLGNVAYTYKGTMPAKTEIVLREGTIGINDNAFKDQKNLTSVTIPEGVTSIGNSAFSGCSGLKSVTIPEGVTSIGSSAFINCSSLKKVIVPDIAAWCGISFGDNGANPLYNAHHLYSDENTEIKELVIPSSVTSIGNYAFYNCSYLTSVTIPEGVTSIGQYAFYNCTYLTSVTIPEGVTSIGQYAFAECYLSLTSVTIPSSVTSIGTNAFYRCSSLKKVIVPDIAAWCDISFGVYSDNPLYYAKHLYSDENTEIKDLVIPEGVTSIGYAAFYNCSSLTSVTIPSSVTGIGTSAFYNCSGLTSVTIPSSVTSIGSSAFNRCSGLTSVYSYMETPPSISEYTFSSRKDATLYVPYGCKAAYESAAYWEEFKEIIEMEPDPTEVTLTIGSAGMGTFASAYDLNFTGIAGVKAYIASGFNPQTGKLVLTPVEEVPAGTGLLVKGKAGEYTIPVETTAMYYTNLLVGLTEDTEVAPTEGDNTNFILANGSHGVSFYTLSEAGTIAAGKAYLTLPTRSVENLANGITLVFDDGQTTGISLTPSPSPTGEESGYYTLDGIKLNGKPMKKGVYIRDGKKVVVR